MKSDRLSALESPEFNEDISGLGSQAKQNMKDSSKLLDRSISIRVSRMNDNQDNSVSDEQQQMESNMDESRQRMSLFSARSGSVRSNFPNITDMYKQQQPSKFQEQVMKRKETEDYLKNGHSVDYSRAGYSEHSPSKFQMSVKGSVKEPLADRFKREEDNMSVASSFKRKRGYSEFQQAVIMTKANEDHADTGSKRAIPETSYKHVDSSKPRPSFAREIDKGEKDVDATQVINKVRRAIKVKLLNNIKFFNILAKTYQIDERNMKERYYYLYNDPSVDLEALKSMIKEAQEKKEQKEDNIKEILGKLDQDKTQKNNPFSKIMDCFKKKHSQNEPDYSYKDQIDIPMKFEPVDNFVFNMYGPYMMLWSAMLFCLLLTQMFVKVVSLKPALLHLFQVARR